MRRLMKMVLWVLAIALVILIGFRVAAALRETQSLADVIPSEGRVVETTQGRFYIEEQGPEDGPPVLLVHGSVGWAGFWRETTAALAAEGYRAIAWDTPPMGYSERDPDGDYSRETQAKRLTALVEVLEIKPILVAHSFGAGIATEAALRAPDAFRGYIIVNGALGLGSHEKGKTLPVLLRPQIVRELLVSATITNPLLSRPLLAAFLHRKDRATDAYLDILSEPGVLKGSTAELARWLPTLLVPPTDALSTRRDALRGLTMPVAVIWGTEDTTTPLAQGEEIATLVPGSTLTVLPDVGHIPQIEDPAAFQRALLAALADMI